MSGSDKSAMARVAHQVNEGLPEAHTGGASGAGGGDAVLADLFGDELAQFAAATVKPPSRGVGRPAGSPNRSTLQLQRLMVARGYRNPLEFLGSIYSADTRQLAADLAGHGDPTRVSMESVATTFAHQIRAAAEAMPYWNSKMPIAVDVTGSEAPRKLIVMGDLLVGNIQQNQQVTQAPAAGSHDDGSHGDD